MHRNQYRTLPRVGVYDRVFNQEYSLRRGQPYRETARDGHCPNYSMICSDTAVYSDRG